MLQATLNGPLSKSDHPAVPISVADLAEDAARCVAAGARSFHIHPRDEEGVERLDPETVDAAVAGVRSRCGQPVGVTTGAWIEPDVARRIDLISRWTLPDFATVNISEDRSLDVMRTLLAVGIGIEAAVWSVADAELLVESGLAHRVLRVCVEPVALPASEAVAFVTGIHQVLNRADLRVPRLQHGDGEAAWVLIEDAIARGIDTRVGLEDTLQLPDGTPASSNVDLVQAAYRLGAGRA